MRNLGFSEDELVEGSLLVRNNNRVYDKFVNRVMFPIFDTRGNIIAYGGRALDPNAPAKYLNSSETYVSRSATIFRAQLRKELQGGLLHTLRGLHGRDFHAPGGV